jgi:hypothetical protein
MTTVQTKRLDTLLRHIGNVRENCELLAQKLEDKEPDFAIKLIANSQIHDNSKFHGIEWQYLHGDIKESDPELFKAAMQQHNENNFHHPEYWQGINNMPRIYVAEMCADWLARSQEFGQCLNDWITEQAIAKYQINVKGPVYKQIKTFVNLMLEGSFK